MDAVNYLDGLLSSRLPEHELVTEGTHIKIYFRKSIAPLAIIAIAVAAVIVIMGLLLTWKLYKATEEPESVILIILGLAAVVGGTLLAARLLGGKKWA